MSYQMQVFAVFIALLIFLKIFLATRVIHFRRAHRVGVGSDRHADLERAIRAHANLCEYSPLFALGLLVLVLHQDYLWLVAALVILFLSHRRVKHGHSWR